MDTWYPVHTKARQERVAAENLTRQHFHTYLPLIRVPKRRRGRWCELVEPLFPGYLFIRLDLQRHNSAPIRSTRGVVGLVHFADRVPSVPTELIDDLLAAPTDLQGAIRRETLFDPGDRVRIVSGPFAGLEATFLGASGEERAQVLLELLGRSNRVLLSCHQLAPAG